MFMLDEDLKRSASFTYDIHLRQQILELTQVISNVRVYYNLHNPINFKYRFRDNPICIWARSSLMNYLHIVEYCKVLQEELYHREYSKLHRCIEMINSMCDNIEFLKQVFPLHKKENYPQFMPDVFKSEDSIFAYRCYYFFLKRYKLPFGTTWKNRATPYWYNDSYFINTNLDFIFKLINSGISNYIKPKIKISKKLKV